MALVAALTGPAQLRTGRRARANAILRFEHPSVGRLELAVPAGDERAHRAVRHLRADPSAFAVIYALLTRAIQVNGAVGQFRYELVHQLTHGPRPANTDRSRLNARVDELLHLLSVAALSWTKPGSATSRRKPAAALQLGPLLSVDVVNRKSRTVTITADAKKELTKYTLPVQPDAFRLSRPAGRDGRLAAPVLARLRLAALVAARWRRDSGQRIAMGDLLARFAWVELGDVGTSAGAAETAGRALRPRLREAIAALADDLAAPARYGAGLTEPVTPTSRAALRTMLALATADQAPAAQVVVVTQPTLDQGRLREAGAPPIFQPTRSDFLAADHDAHDGSLAHDHDEQEDSLAGDQDECGDCLAHDQDAAGDPVLIATVGLQVRGDGAVRLELASGVAIELPAGIARTAGLTADSLAHDHDGAQPGDTGSLAHDHGLPSYQPGHIPDSLDGDQHPATDDPATPRKTRLKSPESFSDDSDRARGNRLTAALAPRPAKPLPPPPEPRRPLPGPDDVTDHRRTA